MKTRAPEMNIDSTGTNPENGETVSTVPERPHLLIVDDSAAARTRILELLENQYEVTPACTGVEALHLARTQVPDAVLCDYHLPELNGLQVLTVFRNDPTLKAVPFIIITGNTDPQTISRCLNAGADDFLHKSFIPEELRARVAAAVRAYRTYQQSQIERRNLARVVSLLAKSEARTRSVIENAMDGIALLSICGTVEALNPMAEKVFGYGQADVLGKKFLDVFIASKSREKLSESWRRLAESGPATPHETRQEVFCLRQDGQEFPAECSFTLLASAAGSGLCLFVRDLTQSRQLETELRQSQKLEAVGRLAAGIAHEINTPIQFIGDNTRFLEQAFSDLIGLLGQAMGAAPPETCEALTQQAEEIELPYLQQQIPKAIANSLQGVQRVAAIVRAMKEFAHPDRREMTAIDLNRSIQATLEVARNEYKYVADVETDFAELPLVICHVGEINQVVLNLIVNAAHAIADKVTGTQNRGQITVSTRREGNDVVIEVSDTGGGIPEEIRDKIFEPFFTTKEVGRGTGQGLATAKHIIAKHQGTMSFQSELGRGTVFLLRIPIEGKQETSHETHPVR